MSQTQSEEELLLDRQRVREKSWMNQARMREETSILMNIKKRELVEMKRHKVRAKTNKMAKPIEGRGVELERGEQSGKMSPKIRSNFLLHFYATLRPKHEGKHHT